MAVRNIITQPRFIAATLVAIIAIVYFSLAGAMDWPPFSGSETGRSNLVILLDRSIAMEGPLDDGTKFEAAIRVINEQVLDQPVAGLENLAFRQYGGPCSGDNTDLLVSFGRDNQDIVRNVIGNIDISGATTLVGKWTDRYTMKAPEAG